MSYLSCLHYRIILVLFMNGKEMWGTIQLDMQRPYINKRQLGGRIH